MMIELNVLKDLFTDYPKEELINDTEELVDYEDHIWNYQLLDDIDYD